MLELLGLLGGALTRFLPLLLDYFKAGRDLKFEVLRMDKEVQLETLRGTNRLAEITANSNASLAQIGANAGAAVDAQWAEGLVAALKGQGNPTGDKWLDRINVSVRPVLTYWWCIVLYTSSKVALLAVAVMQSSKLAELAPIICTDFDRAVIGSIIGFWFVDRALRNAALRK